MKKIVIKPGCISCGACEFRAPEVFEVTDISRVKNDADIKKNKEKIEQAMQGCPVHVIRWGDNEKA